MPPQRSKDQLKEELQAWFIRPENKIGSKFRTFAVVERLCRNWDVLDVVYQLQVAGKGCTPDAIAQALWDVYPATAATEHVKLCQAVGARLRTNLKIHNFLQDTGVAEVPLPPSCSSVLASGGIPTQLLPDGGPPQNALTTAPAQSGDWQHPNAQRERPEASIVQPVPHPQHQMQPPESSLAACNDGQSHMPLAGLAQSLLQDTHHHTAAVPPAWPVMLPAASRAPHGPDEPTTGLMQLQMPMLPASSDSFIGASVGNRAAVPRLYATHTGPAMLQDMQWQPTNQILAAVASLVGTGAGGEGTSIQSQLAISLQAEPHRVSGFGDAMQVTAGHHVAARKRSAASRPSHELAGVNPSIDGPEWPTARATLYNGLDDNLPGYYHAEGQEDLHASDHEPSIGTHEQDAITEDSDAERGDVDDDSNHDGLHALRTAHTGACSRRPTESALNNLRARKICGGCRHNNHNARLSCAQCGAKLPKPSKQRNDRKKVPRVPARLETLPREQTPSQLTLTNQFRVLRNAADKFAEEHGASVAVFAFRGVDGPTIPVSGELKGKDTEADRQCYVKHTPSARLPHLRAVIHKYSTGGVARDMLAKKELLAGLVRMLQVALRDLGAADAVARGAADAAARATESATAMTAATLNQQVAMTVGVALVSVAGIAEERAGHLSGLLAQRGYTKWMHLKHAKLTPGKLEDVLAGVGMLDGESTAVLATISEGQ